MWACGDGTCVFKHHLCFYPLAPLCPDYSDLLYCRNRTAEKERGCLRLRDKVNSYTCLDRSLKEYEESMIRETDKRIVPIETYKRRVPISPPNCTQKGKDGEQLYPCTGYYPNTCGIKDLCWGNTGVYCYDYSSYTCLSKSKAEGCRNTTFYNKPYFQCNQSGYYKSNQIIQRFIQVLHYIYCFYLLIM